jgi:hypothetical protein
LLAGILFADVLTIPTKPADHNAYLSTLVLGNSGNTQTITLEATGQDRLIIPERLIVGDVGSNVIETGATFAIIGGGSVNTIGSGAENASIGAGNNNTNNAKNAVIGA